MSTFFVIVSILYILFNCKFVSVIFTEFTVQRFFPIRICYNLRDANLSRCYFDGDYFFQIGRL